MKPLNKVRVASGVLICLGTVYGFATQIGELNLQTVVSALLMLAGAMALLFLFVWVDERLLGW